jgi:catechol 2,3-dioxygenase-like lactoylglutathione lyase family enzyme
MNINQEKLKMLDNAIKTLKPHISLNVKNVTDSVEFYKKLFGLEPVKFIEGRRSAEQDVKEQSRFGYAKFDLQYPPLNFVLNEVPYADGGSLSHLGIQVESTDDVVKTRDRWIESGLLTVDEMQVDCCYALQDKTWARDPDGNEWEVFVVLENTEPGETSCACGTNVAEADVSAAPCCTDSQKASTIGATNQPCC